MSKKNTTKAATKPTPREAAKVNAPLKPAAKGKAKRGAKA